MKESDGRRIEIKEVRIKRRYIKWMKGILKEKFLKIEKKKENEGQRRKKH